MLITTKERELYTTVWQSIDQYGAYSPGEKYLPLFLDMVGDQRGSILDAGCGSGKGAVALQGAGFTVSMCDVTPDGLISEAMRLPYADQVLWHRITGAFDYAYCCDVLEHIPPQFTMLAVSRLLDVAPKVFIAVCNVADSSGVWIGQSLHQTVQPFTWWRDSFAEIATVTDARDLHENSVFLLERT